MELKLLGIKLSQPWRGSFLKIREGSVVMAYSRILIVLL